MQFFSFLIWNMDGLLDLKKKKLIDDKLNDI